MSFLSGTRIAIVYDWIDKWGGVERVLLTLASMFPDADFYTSYVDREKASWAKDLSIKTSFINSLPSLIKRSRILSLSLYPHAFESFNFSGYDLVISVTSSFAKSVITKPDTLHICYLLTPPRYLWSDPNSYFKTLPYSGILKNSGIVRRFQKYDYIAAQRPDHIISISKTVQERCKKYYDRGSDVVYPPFDTAYWQNSKLQLKPKSREFYLIVSRLEPYKRLDVAIETFNKLRKPLVIVGTGTQAKKLKVMAGDTITFQDSLADNELGELYSRAQALIMPQEEDFGLVALEAQFFGAPVIAYKKGGVIETVQDGKTGIFFDAQIPDSLIKAIERFETIAYNLQVSTKLLGPKNVARFDKNNFIKDFHSLINSKFKVKS